MTENLSMRQQKIARQIQRDMADIFSKEAASFLQGAMVTVTAVRVSPDFGYAKIYVSVFPFDRSTAVMAVLDKQNAASSACRVRPSPPCCGRRGRR